MPVEFLVDEQAARYLQQALEQQETEGVRNPDGLARLSWRFLYEEKKALYSYTGQPSLDPVVFFKLVLVRRLENLVSDRRLVEHFALRLDLLYFLGYEVDEDLPWHSTISRTRQLYPAAVFERLFDHVFAQCVMQGLVAGYTQAVYSAPVKANASLYSLREKQPFETFLPRMQLATEAEPAAPSPPAAAIVLNATSKTALVHCYFFNTR